MTQKNKPRKQRIAVLGAGAWGRNLVRNFHELGVLHAVVDPSAEIRGSAEQQYGIKAYATFDELPLKQLDGVAIAVPVPMHFDLAKRAMEAGLDTYVEKPITFNSKEAEELVALSQKHGRVLMAGHLLLYQPAVRWIGKYLAEGHLGELYGLHLERLTLGRVRSMESVLWDLGVHDIAVILYLAGAMPSRIHAMGHRMLRKDLEDEINVYFEFPDGLRVALHTSWLWPEISRRMIVRGDKGMLVYNEVQQTVTLYRKGITDDLQNRDEGSELIYQGHGQPLRLELEHFLNRMEDRKSPLSDGPSAVQVMKVLEDISILLKAYFVGSRQASTGA